MMSTFYLLLPAFTRGCEDARSSLYGKIEAYYKTLLTCALCWTKLLLLLHIFIWYTERSGRVILSQTKRKVSVIAPFARVKQGEQKCKHDFSISPHFLISLAWIFIFPAVVLYPVMLGIPTTILFVLFFAQPKYWLDVDRWVWVWVNSAHLMKLRVTLTVIKIPLPNSFSVPLHTIVWCLSHFQVVALVVVDPVIFKLNYSVYDKQKRKRES